MQNNRAINWNKLTSLGVGAGVTTISLMVSLKVGAIPSFFASIVGLGGVVQFACGAAGTAGGIGMYLYGAKQLKCWPMDAPPRPEQSTLSKVLYGSEEDKSLFDEMKVAAAKIEDEVKFCSQQPQREQIFTEGRKKITTLFNQVEYLKKAVTTFSDTFTKDENSRADEKSKENLRKKS